MKHWKRMTCLMLCFFILGGLLPTIVPTSSAAESWLWPAEDCYIISSNYGLRDLYGTGSFTDYHHGIDIVGASSTYGMPVRAAKSGTIYSSCNTIADNTYISGSCGNYVAINHGDGTYSIYMHMRPSGVKTSGTVRQGDIIGYIGNTGDSYGAHLHFEMYTNPNNRHESTLNPMPTNSNITIRNTYVLPSGWPSEKTTYIFDTANSSMLNLGDDFYAYIILDNPWLHVEAAKDGTVQLAEDGNNSKDPRQIWHFVRDTNGSYEISNEYADLRLDAHNWGTENGTRVAVGTDNDSTAQRWFLMESGSACKIAASYKTDMVLTVKGGVAEAGTPIQLYEDNNSTSQRFSIYMVALDGVTYEKPSRPAASSITSVSTSDGMTTITWSSSSLNSRYDEREYDLRIWNGDISQVVWNETYFTKYGITETSYEVSLPDGKYTFCVTAVNNRYQYWYTTGSYYEYTVKTGCNYHNYSYAISTEPTMSSNGILTGTCSYCGATTTVKLPKLNETDYNYSIIKNPTCTETGVARYTWRTTSYGAFYFDIGIDALGHAWDSGVVTKEPTETEPGEKTYACMRCGATKTQSVPATGGQTDLPCDGGTDCLSAKFTDVRAKDWYHLAVDFAVENGLFGGMTPTTFEPNTAMTRAMLVTVLWRYEGEPEAAENTFSDVKAGTWYSDAVSWAAANGVVNGVGNNKFDPEGKITREQMATILYRYSDRKGIDTSKQGSLSGFPDASQVSSYARTALQWTVAEGIIGGSDGKLLPQGNATRAQVATILMRFIENIS